MYSKHGETANFIKYLNRFRGNFWGFLPTLSRFKTLTALSKKTNINTLDFVSGNPLSWMHRQSQFEG